MFVEFKKVFTRMLMKVAVKAKSFKFHTGACKIKSHLKFVVKNAVFFARMSLETKNLESLYLAFKEGRLLVIPCTASNLS